ncbi:MAG: serpin family protein [Deltaproteobacteria bacterium]|jgi:serpin B|nr:serpin family protein [Deltaproteobacteria bacterium]
METMMLITLVVLGLVICVHFLAVKDERTQISKGGGMNKIVEGNNVFATDLYRLLATKTEKNLFFGPNSIHTALGMTYLGAGSETAKEIGDVLFLGLAREQVGPAFSEVIHALHTPQMVQEWENVGKECRQKEVPACELSVANALWAAKNYPFRKSYVAEVRKHFEAVIKTLDFRSHPEPSREIINSWVEDKTNQKIKDLLSPGHINNDTQLVLTNAVYFMSNWALTFSKRATRDLPFTLIDGTKMNCPQMFQQAHLSYLDTKDFHGISLPYKGHGMEMILFLPKKLAGLQALENKLSTSNLNMWINQFKHQEVQVTLPRFRFSYGDSMVNSLKRMGVKKAFSAEKADFSGMTKKKELFFSEVIHKAFVAVDEEGTEAAAATAVIMTLGASPLMAKPEPKIFKADHPFLFIIRHKKTGAILFMGRLMDPKE